jgi:AcrR family transcriptional regulator
MTPHRRRPARTDVIADAAIEMIAREGLRALTHRAVDRAAGLPQGSASYYAPTRRALLTLTVARLAHHSTADTRRALEALDAGDQDADLDSRLTGLVAVLAGFMGALLARSVHMRARYALLLEFGPDDELHQALAAASSVQSGAAAAAELMLSRMGVSGARERAQEIIRLVDALVFSQTAAPSPTARRDAEAIVAAYLRGVM